jgi:hypothetical protein
MDSRRAKPITQKEILAGVRKPLPPRTVRIESKLSKQRRARVKKFDE